MHHTGRELQPDHQHTPALTVPYPIPNIQLLTSNMHLQSALLTASWSLTFIALAACQNNSENATTTIHPREELANQVTDMTLSVYAGPGCIGGSLITTRVSYD